MLINKKLGKLAPVVNPLTPVLSNYMKTDLPVSSVVDYTKVNMPWQMMKNDSLGCCAIATVGHLIMAYTAYTENVPYVMADEQIETFYEIIGGYKPGDESTDNGCVVTNVLDYWMTHGVRAMDKLNQISGYAAVDPKNLNEVNFALKEFVGLYIGIQFPKYLANPNSDFSVSPNGLQIWDVPGPNDDPTIEGGHAIPLLKINDNGNYTCITWGEEIEITPAFFQQYCDECFCLIDSEYIKGNKSISGVDNDKLIADLKILQSGQVLN